jgi:hypothetical protein
LLFIFAIMNIFIFVIEDAFNAAKTWDKKQWKELQSFTLSNLIAILELEGKELVDQESSHAGWQLLEPENRHERNLRKSTKKVGGDSFGAMKDERSPLIPSSSDLEPVSSDLEQPVRMEEDIQGEAGPWPLQRSITSAIKLERRRKREKKTKDKEEVDDVTAVLDAALERMQNNLKAEFEVLKKELRRNGAF